MAMRFAVTYAGVFGSPPILKREDLKKFMSDLSEISKEYVAMDRYERRALSRRKFAMRAFDAAPDRIGYDR
jgi:hypothetical protein